MRRVILAGFIALAVCACRPVGHEPRPVAASSAPASMPPPSLAARISALPIDLSGPAWTLRIRPDSLTLARPGHPDITVANPGPQMLGDAAAWDAPSTPQSGLLIVTVTPGVCAIEGSSATYPFHAAVEADGDRLIGCGAPAG